MSSLRTLPCGSAWDRMTYQPVCIADFEHYLRRNLSSPWCEYFTVGANDGQTHADNVKAFKRYRLRPRCLRDVSNRDIRSSILGHDLEFPVGVSPSACHAVVHKDGEIATAKGAASSGSAFILSVWANTSLEDVAASVPVETPLFMQLNVFADREMTMSVVRRVEATGRYRGLVVTVDQPIRGKRLSSHPIMPSHLRYANIKIPENLDDKDVVRVYDPSFCWKDITWLKEFTSLPLILKGILTAADARMAVSHGAAGILVSNHGGRQLDGVCATIDALSEVVDAVRGSNVEVYLDGGVRNGTDVLKALALGARAVFIGRPAIWGLAYDGEAGVKKVLGILKEEFSTAMALSGCASLADITPDLVTTPSYSKL
ncbi:2-Hydroxyacid oxidase 1-like isoform X2 [Asterias amurensis]|uniref:2-Hydroxyacid oxidase 1-like isoform X2 n=1 Tax=Asterias amurensis TaxID=7602 RepID=UPI003AB1A92B